MHAQILGFPTALGLPRTVSEEGPAALRRLGLVQALEHVLEVTDLGDLAVESPDTGARVDGLLQQVVAAARRQARAFTQAYGADSLPITLGGDHTTSLGTAVALNELCLSYDVVWLDAHADFNTPITSPSGHPHGMVLALLAGLTPYLPQTVPPWRLHLWGYATSTPASVHSWRRWAWRCATWPRRGPNGRACWGA
jgi:arginase